MKGNAMLQGIADNLKYATDKCFAILKKEEEKEKLKVGKLK